MYTELEDAIHFVFVAFNNQKRIKEDINLAFHSVSVAAMLAEEKCNYETILIGLLHDIIEDTDYTYDDLKNMYNDTIADSVLLLSEKQNIIDFKERKLEFISRISKANENIILIEIADKLHNLLSDYEKFQKYGKEALATLDTTYEMNKWYYLEMLKLFESKITNSKLLERYKDIVNIYFKEDIYE